MYVKCWGGGMVNVEAGGVGTPGARVIGGCELLDVGIELGSLQKQEALLTSEPSP